MENIRQYHIPPDDNDGGGSDSCIICLEPLLTTTISSQQQIQQDQEYIATLPLCDHIYHDLCIKAWSERTNSCPACRTSFNQINLRETIHGPIMQTLTIRDKKAPTHDESGNNDPNSVGLEDDWQLGGDVIDYEDGPFSAENCVICASGERAQELLICDGCDRTFHITCLGLDEVPFCDWFCPTCEVDQNEYNPIPTSTSTSTYRQLIRSFTRPGSEVLRDEEECEPVTRRRRNNLGRYRRTRRAFVSETREQVRRARRARVQSTMTNSNGDVSDNNAMVVERPQLSSEEVQAWEMLEKAQNLEDTSNDGDNRMQVDSTVPESSTANVRKLKRPCRRKPPTIDTELLSSSTTTASISTSISTSTSASASSLSSEPSFVQSLLTNIRNASPTHTSPLTPLKYSMSKRQTLLSPTIEQRPDWSSSAASPSSFSSPELSAPNSPSPGSFVLDDQSLSDPGGTRIRDDRSISPPAYNRNNNSDGNSRVPRSPILHTMIHGRPTRPSLSLDKKEQVQSMVRDALRPVYRSGRIDKDQYTRINQRVSRAMYDLVIRDVKKIKELKDSKEIMFEAYRKVIDDYVHNELEAIK